MTEKYDSERRLAFRSNNPMGTEAGTIPIEWDELSPQEQDYYQNPPFSTHSDFLGAKGGSAQLVQPGPGRQGYAGDDVKDVVEFAIKKSKHKLRGDPRDVKNISKLEDLYREIKKYNAMDDITVEVKSTHPKQIIQKRDISEKMLLEKVGFKSKAGNLPAARYLIDNYFLTTVDKMERDLKKMMSSSDTKLSDAIDFTQKLSTKYNRDLTKVQKMIKDFPIVKENKELFLKLTNPQSTAKLKRKQHFDLMTIGDFIEESNFKKNFSIKVVNPEQTLQSYAYKHTFVHDGDKIQWLTDPHKTPQSEWVFKYNGKTYDQHALSPMNSRKDPNFAKFWKTDDQILNYLDYKITDTEVLKKLGYKKPTTMGTIMKDALGHGTGSKGYKMFEPLERDHINLKKDPFDVRPMNKRFNIGEGTLKKALLKGRISRAEYNQGIKKIGYEYMGGLDLDDPKAFDDLIKRDLDFAVKAKTRSKKFLRTPATIAREHSALKSANIDKKLIRPTGTTLHSFPGPIGAVLGDLGSKTKKTTGFFGIDLLWGIGEYINEQGKGKERIEAKGIAWQNATLGLIPLLQQYPKGHPKAGKWTWVRKPGDKRYEQNLLKIAEELGMDVGAIKQAIEINKRDVKAKDMGLTGRLTLPARITNLQEKIAKITSGEQKLPWNAEKNAAYLEKLESTLANYTSQLNAFNKETDQMWDSYVEDLRGKKAVLQPLQLTPIGRASPERLPYTTISQEEADLAFSQIPSLAIEKLRREKKRSYDEAEAELFGVKFSLTPGSKRTVYEAGPLGGPLIRNIFNMDAWRGSAPIPGYVEDLETLKPTPLKQKQAEIQKAISEGRLEEYNLATRGVSKDQPISLEDYEILKAQYPWLNLNEGGRVPNWKEHNPFANMAGGGIATLHPRRPGALPPPSGPDSQGLAYLNNYATKRTE